MNAKLKLAALVALVAIVFVGIDLWQAETEEHPAEASVSSAWSNDVGSQTDASAWDSELHVLEARVKEQPHDTTHLLQLARRYQEVNRPADAIPIYRRYLDLVKRDEQSWLDLANCYGMLGDWQGALEVTQNLLDINPQNTSALYNLGAIHANLGNTGEAASSWHQVLQLQPDSTLLALTRESLKKISAVSK